MTPNIHGINKVNTPKKVTILPVCISKDETTGLLRLELQICQFGREVLHPALSLTCSIRS